jgi:HD-GYP domain-containing protein (c-di-GMP phosphodiesterase class II)
MLKKIPVSQVRLGMHLHALEGAWIDHPFWKSRFVVRDPADLEKLRASSVREVWIDPAKGLDVEEVPPAVAAPKPSAAPAPAPAPVAAAAPAPAPVAAPAPTPAPPVPDAPRELADELGQAARVCQRARAQVESMFGEARLGKAVDAEACLPLVADIADSVFRHPGALVSLARLKTQDDYSYMHSVAVCALMVALARSAGKSLEECRIAGLAGLLHDLGKALMPLEVLNKPGKLTDAEFEIMKGHPVRGHELLLEARGTHPAAMDVCLHHHERIDGTGYPHRLAGGHITELARMGAICDVYDAVTSDRPYKRGWDPADSIAKMASWKGHFDTTLFATFVKSLGIYPTGSLVRLQSERLAVVVDQNPGALTAPVVRVFFSLKSGMPVPLTRLDLSLPSTSDRIAAREAPEKWNFSFLEELWAGDALPRRA